jgi:creatinine amidohydrolase
MRHSGSGSLLAGMTSPEVRDQVDRGRSTVVVPFGAVEQHGAHLPLDTDALLGDRLGLLLAERLDALCAPTVRIGCSHHHMAFAGTISLRPETLEMIVGDVVDSLARHGFRAILLLQTHGGNEQPLTRAAAARERGEVSVFVPSLRAAVEAVSAAAAARGEPLRDAGGHAGELETSLMLALAPDLVTAGLMQPGYTGPFHDAATRLLFTEGAAALAVNGVLGDPRGASADAGRLHLAALLDAMEGQLRRAPNAATGDRASRSDR